MRLYSFTNFYLSPLQYGLQTAHCVSEMAAMVRPLSADYSPLRDKFYDWAENHKTIIICNGGNQAMLEDLFTKLIDPCHALQLPLVKFYEDEQSLGGALTSVALLVSEMLYDTKFLAGAPSGQPGLVPDGPACYVYEADNVRVEYKEGTPEFALIALIKSYRLA